MRRTIQGLCVALCLAAALAAVPAEAVDFGVRTGIYTDQSDAFLGGELLFQLAPRWFLNPNLEWVFVEDGDLFTLNGDVHYDFDVDFDGYVWAGGGVALISSDVDDDRPPRDDDDGDTDVGLNVLAGVGWRAGGLTPYVQGKVIVADETEAVLAVGLRF